MRGSTRPVIWGISLALCWVLAGDREPAQAGVVFYVGLAGGGGVEFQRSSSDPLEVLNQPVSSTGSAVGSARAGQGYLGAKGETAAQLAGFSLSAFIRSTATFRAEDFIFSGPSGGSIAVSLNLHLDGELAATGMLPGVGVHLFSSSAAVEVGWAQNNLGSIGVFGSYSIDSFGGASSSGVLSGLSGSAIDLSFSTPVIMVPVNVPVTLGVGLRTSSLSIAVGRGGQTAASESDFLNSLTFPTIGPVFNLPSGYTVNSASLGITDNTFGAPAAVVPEPSSLALLGVGAASLAGLRLWRRRLPGGAAARRANNS